MSGSFLEWDEVSVNEWLGKAGYGQYEESVIEQGITGDVLALLDARALADLGVASLGHRLGILRAIWDLKMEQGVEVGADEWRPSDEHRHSYASSYASSQASTIQPSLNYPSIPSLHGPAHAHLARPSVSHSVSDGGFSPTTSVDPMMGERMWDMIAEQNERIAGLEADMQKILQAMTRQTKPEDSASQAQSQRYGGRDRQREVRDVPEAEAYRKMASRWSTETDDEAGTLIASSDRNGQRAVTTASPIRSTHSESAQQSTSTTAALVPAPPAKHKPPHLVSKPATSSKSGSLPAPPPLNRTISSTGMVATPQSQGFSPGVMDEGISSTPASAQQAIAQLAAGNASSTPVASLAKDAKSNRDAVVTASGGVSSSAANAHKDAASAAKSFRVTLDDPCWKVLPAALKKYKIPDDWRQYAMFICFGNTERCLSFDEKPLLLFQKLKESNQKPVFMLRHMRDIKSPIAVAQQKQASRTGSRAAGSASAPGTAKSSTPVANASTSTTPTTSNPHPYSKDTRLHRPPVLQPVSAKAKAAAVGASINGKTTPGSGNGQGNFPELPSPGMRTGNPQDGYAMADEQDGERKVSFAIAIYPYVAEREDEFDVDVGATFSILNKAKGWWVVQKDPGATGTTSADESLSGWVPAGCLLELSTPLADIAAAATPETPRTGPLSLHPIPYTCVTSSSFPGIALMDYQKKGDDELDLKRDDLLRVFKRYNFYSYCILEATGERGWCPSWFISKARPSGSGASSGNTTADLSLDLSPTKAETPAGRHAEGEDGKI